MVNFIVRRILQTIPVLFGVIVITFILMYMVPGDPVVSMVGERYDEETIHKLRKELHLDDSLPMQFVHYVSNVMRGDFGKSFITGGSVSEELLIKFPNTLILAVASMIVAIITGLTMGIVSSLKPQSILDKITMFFALAGISAPVFWVGLMLI
ncbi:MAG TPA: peptide ABC transporter permease, partial [Candidatus Marinimicrobia bacterium]|nr:peptide ABC transporter permease [Candidatus Neomarinimicrobiota bacterium]